MTAPRVRQWYSFAATNNALTADYSAQTNVPEGTIQRVIGTVSVRTDSAPPGGSQFVFSGWQLNVGLAAAEAIPIGANDPGVMIQRTMVIPSTPPSTVAVTPVPAQTFDLEGQRIVGAGEHLWFSAETGQPSVLWLWTVALRVLVLLPA